TSLIQTIGRAARNADGTVIMYADTVTPSMERAITETERRRTIQTEYNEKNGIVPKTVIKGVRDVIEMGGSKKVKTADAKRMSKAERDELIKKMTEEMKQAAKLLEFEYAAELRDKIANLKKIK
ncbi:MAG: UvrB/UvrC motif-containing protein, partial [Clostridia bacterium]|nr:UvrB/UvrC motif-containing protein [Clostridia bacterium]